MFCANLNLGNVRYESRRDRGPQVAPPEILAFLNRPGLTITEASGPKKVAEAPRSQSRNVVEARSELIITETSSSKNDSMYHCEFCNYQTTSIQRLQNHLEDHKSSRSQCCNVCGKVFKNLSSLQNHMASHDPSRSFTCMYCEKQFKHQSSLKSHMKTHFNYEQKCPICDKVLPSESAFKKHMLSHQLQ